MQARIGLPACAAPAARVVKFQCRRPEPTLRTALVSDVQTQPDKAQPQGRADRSSRRSERRARIKRAVTGFSRTSRRLVSEHRQRRKQRDREISDQSRRGLDWTNFFMADVLVGFGSFLAFYLADLGWPKQDVGLVLTVGGLAGVAVLIPGGALADAARWKRGLAALGIGMIAASALILALWPRFELVLVAELMHGVTAGMLGPAIAAISLGLTGRRGMSLRVGRNFRFAAAGNALTAAAMGALGAYAASGAIFLATAALCIPALIALSRIRPEEIDYARARNAARRDHTIELQRMVTLTKNRDLLIFAGCLVIYHVSNASLLPLISQTLAQSKVALSSLYMAGLIIVPQLVVALLAPWIGYWSELWGRKPLLLIGFGAQAARALLFALVNDPWLMIVVQILDGITGAIVTVLTILVITDLTAGTGRFNLAQGMVGTLTGIAAAASTAAFGLIAGGFGDATSFLTMAVVTVAGMALLWAFLPETKPDEYGE
jgi:predicted MFS family arabinose efflux permease